MTYNLTAFLSLRKPVKGSAQQYDSDIYSADLQAIDDFATETDDRLTVLEGTGSGPVILLAADLATLVALTPDRGSLCTLQSSAYTGLSFDLQFLRGSGAWRIVSPTAVFDTKAHLDTFVTAASAYMLAGQRFWTTTAPGYEWTWDGSAVEPTRIVQATTAPTGPVTGQLWVDTTP